MDSRIKQGWQRKAFYRSKSESQAEDSLPARSLIGNSPRPCPGRLSSPPGIPEQIGFNAKENTQTNIVLELQRKVDKLTDKVDQLLSATKTITHFIHSCEPGRLHKTVRAECEAAGIECSANEPNGLLRESTEKEPLYQDASQLSTCKLQTHSIDNQLYGYIGENNEVSIHHELVSEKQHGHQTEQDVDSVKKDRHQTEQDVDSEKKDRHQTEQDVDSEKKDRHQTEQDVDSEKKHRPKAGHEKMTMAATKPKEFRSNSLQTRVKMVAVEPRPRSAIYTNKVVFDERECLANALQFHIEDLVDGLVFHDSELPDVLLVEGCLTEDECSTVRKLRDRKDQIRILLSLIKGRDLRVLKGFLKHVAQQNQAVAEKVSVKFESNKREGVRGKLCALCNLEKQFNVKHAADSLWAIQAIDDGLYNIIIYSETPVGDQSTVWKRVFHSLNVLDQQKAELAQNNLKHALSKNNLFLHLADGVKDLLIKNHGKLTCACEPRLILPKRTPSFGAMTSAESFLPDSSSDGASNDLSSFDGSENGDTQYRDNSVVNDGMSLIAEVNETPSSPSSVLSNDASIAGGGQHEDTISVTVSTNSPETSLGDSCSGESHFIQPKTSVPSKKPVPARKPPVPAKKPELKLNSLKKSTRQQTDSYIDISPLLRSSHNDIPNSSLKTETQSGSMLKTSTGVETDAIPQLPEKKNRQPSIAKV